MRRHELLRRLTRMLGLALREDLQELTVLVAALAEELVADEHQDQLQAALASSGEIRPPNYSPMPVGVPYLPKGQ
jgi:hypothetical protein